MALTEKFKYWEELKGTFDNNNIIIIIIIIIKGDTSIYTGCNRRNVRDFGRVFLMLNYTDITQNTYIQS